MIHKVITRLLCAVAWLLFFHAAAQAQDTEYESCDCVPGELIVGFKHDATNDDIESIRRLYGLQLSSFSDFGSFKWGTLIVPERQERVWINILEKNAHVDFVEPNHYMHGLSVGSAVSLNRWKQSLLNSSTTINSLAGVLRDYIPRYIDYRYPAANSKNIIPLGDNLVRVDIAGIKSEIIDKNKYWEKISINFIYTQESSPMIYVLVEG